jgi:hypothetical protein
VSDQLNTQPTYEDPLVKKGFTTRGWYSFWAGLLNGQPVGLPFSVVLTASPMRYQATIGGQLIIQGGTVSLVSISRDGITSYNTGQTQGFFPVSRGDVLTINYSGTPILTFVPK